MLVRQGRVVAATFHPELTASRALHRYVVELAGEQNSSVSAPDLAPEAAVRP